MDGSAEHGRGDGRAPVAEGERPAGSLPGGMRYHSTAMPLLISLRRRLTASVLSLVLGAGGAISPAVAHELPELGDVAGEELPLMLEKKIGQPIMQEIRQREISYLDDYDV